ncbi:AAA family ATPase [Seiridium cupressi]
MAPSILVTGEGGGEPTSSTKDVIIPIVNGHVNGKKESDTSNGEASVKTDDVKDEAGVKGKESSDGEPQDDTMKCEIKHLDRRYDDKDEQYLEERKNDVEKPKQKDWWRLFAFCLVRHYDTENELSYTRLYVNPQPIRQLLYDVIGSYPSDPIDVDDVQIEAPYHALFYYREEIESQGVKRFEEDEDNESLSQLKLLLSWIATHFETDTAAYKRCVNGDVKAIGYDYLWTLFPPSTIIYSELLEQHRAFRVTESWYDYGELPGLGLKVKFVDFDGERLGNRKMELFIPKYGGTQELGELPTMPLHLLEDANAVREDLYERGRTFESYIGQHFVQYNGIALKKMQKGYARFNVTGRVMIDCKTYHRIEPNDSFHVKVLTNDESAKNDRARKRARGNTEFVSEEVVHDRLSDEDVLLCNATVRGYSFTAKKFLEFFADQLFPIEWNTRCFDDLVLDAGTKKTVQALVSTHSEKRETFDDIVKGKGQGLVCVLHGPPGVGKTLTAECVAEFVRRPLYMVSSGDLGTTSGDLDHQLTRIMDMTSTWRAVLLIDEADVFLEKRSLHDLHRNAMVSVFLRVLEYYSGILFLTTNRVNTFDDAFKSRIHIPIRYTDLSIESRMQIWRNFCKMVPGGVDIDDVGIAILAEHDLNGRQIKNVIKAAESLATFDKIKLDLKTLQQVTKIQATFEKDLTSLSGVDYTAPGASRKDADSRHMFL